MVPEEPKPLPALFCWPGTAAVLDADEDDDVDVPVFVGRSPPWVEVLKTVTVDPPGSVVVPMGVDEGGVVGVVGVGVVVGEGVSLDVVGGGEDVVGSVEEEEGLGVKEEEDGTGGGLLLAIELDVGSEVLVGDDEGGEVVGTPVFVLEVELVAIVNCLLNTSFLGCLEVAMSAKGTLHGCAASSSTSIRRERIIPQAWAQSKSSSAAAPRVVWVVRAGASMFRVLERASDVLCAGCCFAFTGGLIAAGCPGAVRE